MGSPASSEDSAARVERISQAGPDPRMVRLRILDEIRAMVPFDYYAWVLTDPVTSVGSSPLADVPCLSELPRLIRLKYLTPVNRWTGLIVPAALLTEATGGVLSRSLVWRELLTRYDVADVASVVFRDSFGCWGFLDLWRSSRLGPFTSVDRRYLTDLSGPVTLALRRSQAQTFARVAEPGQPRGPVVLLLSSELEVLAQTAETEKYLRALVPPGGNRSPIPASAYNVAAQLLAVHAGIDDNPPIIRVHLSGGRWLTLRAAWLGDRQPSSDATIAVTVEDSSPSERAEVYARAHGLSARERELLGLLIAGKDTAAIARSMFLSHHTVQDHLKSIFTKTSVHSRRDLSARALGS